MATPTETNKALTAAPEQNGLIDIINASQKELARALPKHISADRMVRIATTCIRQNPTLAKCTPASFLGSLFTASQVGLEPVAGLCYLIPFQNSKLVNGQWVKVWEAQFVMGFRGTSELFYRHEKGGLIDWGTVHENDDFEYEYGTEAKLKHKPATKNRGKAIGHYVIFKLAGGFTKFYYMTVEECMEHGKKHSKTYDSKTGQFNKKSPWATNPEPMCLKTVLLQGAKTVPLSTELRQALSADETSRDFRDGVSNAFELPDNTNWQDTEAEEIPKALPKVDTSKVNTELSKEDLEKKAAEVKARKEQMEAEEKAKVEAAKASTETPADAPASPADEPEGKVWEDEPPAAKTVTLKGLIADHKQMGKGPHRFYIEGQWCQTFDKKLAIVLRDHKANDNEVKVACHEEANGEYVNMVVDTVEPA